MDDVTDTGAGAGAAETGKTKYLLTYWAMQDGMRLQLGALTSGYAEH